MRGDAPAFERPGIVQQCTFLVGPHVEDRQPAVAPDEVVVVDDDAPVLVGDVVVEEPVRVAGRDPGRREGVDEIAARRVRRHASIVRATRRMTTRRGRCRMRAVHQADDAATLELLTWISRGSRTYADAMEVWGSHCPRHTVWEDALAACLV